MIRNLILEYTVELIGLCHYGKLKSIELSDMTMCYLPNFNAHPHLDGAKNNSLRMCNKNSLGFSPCKHKQHFFHQIGSVPVCIEPLASRRV